MKKGGKEFDRDYKFDSDYIWPEGEILFYSLYLPASKILCSAQALVIQSEKKNVYKTKMKVLVPLSGRDVRPYCREQRKQGI